MTDSRKKQIEEEAREYIQREFLYHGDLIPNAEIQITKIYLAACTAREREIERLKQWKSEHALVNEWWAEVDSFIQQDPSLGKLGESKAGIAIRLLKESKERIEKLGAELKTAREDERRKVFKFMVKEYGYDLYDDYLQSLSPSIFP